MANSNPVIPASNYEELGRSDLLADGFINLNYEPFDFKEFLPKLENYPVCSPAFSNAYSQANLVSFVPFIEGLVENGEAWAEAVEYLLPPVEKAPPIVLDLSTLQITTEHFEDELFYRLTARPDDESLRFFKDLHILCNTLPQSHKYKGRILRTSDYQMLHLAWLSRAELEDVYWFKGQLSLELLLNDVRDLTKYVETTLNPLSYSFGTKRRDVP